MSDEKQYGTPLGVQAPSKEDRPRARAGQRDPFKVADADRAKGESKRPARANPTKRSTDEGTSVFKSYEARQADQIEKESN
jgi:hypothetical protein